MVRPHHETEGANNDDCPHHHAVAKDILARMDADEVRDDAECWQGNNVNLGVAEEPEQVLEEQRITADMIGLVAHGHDRGHKEARA